MLQFVLGMMLGGSLGFLSFALISAARERS